jgi:polyphosphate kinase
VYYFRNGGDEEYFIGSADLMQRNLESRVEVCVPVESSRLRQQLREMLDLQLRNRRNVWEMGPDGEYRQREARGREGAVCIHRQLIERAEKQRSGRKKSANRKKG